VNRPRSPHTRRSYEEGALSFVRYRGIVWPQEASSLLLVSIAELQEYRDALAAGGAAPKTINHRVSALSSFYKYLALSAAELRLPIVVPNPAHSQFIARESSDPREETLSLPAARARQLLNLPTDDSVLAYRDRAIVKLYLYSGIRLAAGCHLLVEDFRQDGHAALTRKRRQAPDHRFALRRRPGHSGIRSSGRVQQWAALPAAAAFAHRRTGNDGHTSADHVGGVKALLE
jgi:site-specific recombinase XerC